MYLIVQHHGCGIDRPSADSDSNAILHTWTFEVDAVTMTKPIPSVPPSDLSRSITITPPIGVRDRWSGHSMNDVFAGRDVLVTGALGFIGSVMLAKMLKVKKKETSI